MNKKIKKLLLLSISLVITLTSTITVYAKNQVKDDEFFKFMKQVQQKRDEMDKNPIVDISKYSNWLDKNEKDLTNEEIKRLIDSSFDRTEYDHKKVISYNEAKEDVEHLFKLLRNSYGPYQYFGGDEVFNAAKTKILNWLEGKESIKCNELNIVMIRNLKFLQDKHFFLGAGKTAKVMESYKFNDYDFYEGNEGFFRIKDNKKQYIKSIDGNNDINSFMKVTINKDGKLVYTIGWQKEFPANSPQDSNPISVSVQFSGDKKDIEEKLTLMPQGKVKDMGKPYDYFVKDNVPVIKYRSFLKDSNGSTIEKDFIETANKVKDYPVFMLDLRGALGGVMNSPNEWMKKYFGQTPEHRGASVNVYTKLLEEYLKKRMNSPWSDEPIENEFYVNKVESSGRVKNNRTVFVLVDKYNASSAELFLLKLLNCDNVVLVGNNSLGAVISLNICEYKLINSKMSVDLGYILNITEYGDNIDGKGLEPDIWVDPNEALEKVQSLINNYNLAGKNNGGK